MSSSSPEYRATQKFYDSFGEEPVEVLVKGNLQQLCSARMSTGWWGWRGACRATCPRRRCAGGRAHGPCGQLAKAKTVKVVFGPGTFINEAAEQIDEQLTPDQAGRSPGQQAEQVVRRQRSRAGESRRSADARQAGEPDHARRAFKEGLATLALQYGLTSQPSLDDPSFVSTLVFDSNKPAGTPKPSFAYLFPSREAALISVRMKAGLCEAQRTRTIALIHRAVAMKQWRLQHGESYLVTGEPVIVSDLTG